MNVLLVDDEREICTLLVSILTRAGIGAVATGSLSGAREALAQGTFNAVFLDVHLPDGIGYDLLPLIRRDHPASKVIMISAVDSEADAAMRKGVDLFLPKPFTKQTILDKLQHVFPNRHH